MRPDLKGPASLFDRTKQDGRSFVPTSSRSAAARSGGPGRPPGRRASALPWTGASPAARCRLIGAAALLLSLQSVPTRASAAEAGPVDLPQIVVEAADRFGIPAPWIIAVMRRESGLDVRAVSPAGAVGLMQLMPQTYAELRARYGLGEDPFRPRDNVLAGAAYLREMFDRFGARGFLAAYNAGPARYAQHLAGRQLPAETRAYVTALAPVLANIEGAPAARRARRGDTLFVELTTSSPASASAAAPASDGLFAALTPTESGR